MPGEGGGSSAFHAALGRAEAQVDGIAGAAQANLATCESVLGTVRELAEQVDRAASALEAARGRAGTFLGVSESLLELTASSGVNTADTPYIEGITLSPSSKDSSWTVSSSSHDPEKFHLSEEVAAPSEAKGSGS